MEGTILFIIAQQKVSDKIYDEFNIDDEEFHTCFKKHELEKDPKVIQKTNEMR